MSEKSAPSPYVEHDPDDTAPPPSGYGQPYPNQGQPYPNQGQPYYPNQSPPIAGQMQPMNYGQVLPGYDMQQPMQQAHPQQIQVAIQEQPIVQQPVQQQVQDVELLRIPQELQCPQCKLTVSGVIMITSMALKSLAEADVTSCPCLKLS